MAAAMNRDLLNATLASRKPIVCLRAPISNGARNLPNGQLPSRIKILSWGENHSVKGTFLLTDRSADTLPDLQRSTGYEQVVLDFEHNTVPGTEEYERSQEPRKVAAYGTPRIVRGDGLYLEGLHWTPCGEQHAHDYRDLSPAIQTDERNEVVFVHSVALTRNGAIHGLSFYCSGN